MDIFDGELDVIVRAPSRKSAKFLYFSKSSYSAVLRLTSKGFWCVVLWCDSLNLPEWPGRFRDFWACVDLYVTLDQAISKPRNHLHFMQMVWKYHSLYPYYTQWYRHRERGLYSLVTEVQLDRVWCFGGMFFNTVLAFIIVKKWDIINQSSGLS